MASDQELKELPKKKLKPIIRCCISHCKNDQPPFFSFPKTGSIRNSWEEATGKFNVKTFSNQKVCMKHFSPDDLVRDLKSELLGLPAKPKLKPETVPHLNLVKQETIIEKSAEEIQPQVTRSGRIVKLKVKTSPKNSIWANMIGRYLCCTYLDNPLMIFTILLFTLIELSYSRNKILSMLLIFYEKTYL